MPTKPFYLLLVLFVVLAAGCVQATAPEILVTVAPTSLPTNLAPVTPTQAKPEPEKIPLVAYTSDSEALASVVPSGWVEYLPGWFGRQETPRDSSAVFQMSYPQVHPAWGPVVLARKLNLAQVPLKAGERHTTTLDWDLYSTQTEMEGAGEIFVDLAVAELDGVLYIAGVQGGTAERELLYQDVFLPMVDALQPAPVTIRDRIAAADLLGKQYSDPGPVRNEYFMPLEDSGTALAPFQGRLDVPAFELQRNALSPAQPGKEIFPAFSTEFVTVEGKLIPLDQEILPAGQDGSFWRMILSPGSVWSEAGDGGMSRASFPFVLTGSTSGEAHNGLATFLYDENGASAMRVQVIQETAAWDQADYWGQTKVVYSPGEVAGMEVVLSEQEAELAQRIPVRSWTDLYERYDPRLLAGFTGGLDLASVSATGVLFDGNLYLQPCFTRYGPFPYCEAMRHGAFSVTKTMAPAVALLRLAQKYGENVFDLKINDYVQVPTGHDGWEAVTLGDALNMATGIGDDPSLLAVTAEEDAPRFFEFMDAKSAAEKLAVIGGYGQYPWGPGEKVRYNSINTFVLAMALSNFYKEKEGSQADLWEMVEEEVYRPIGITHAPIQRTIEPDGSPGTPVFGYGLFPTVQDIAKVAQLLLDGGEHAGVQLLHPGRLAEMMRQTSDIGLPTNEHNVFGEGRYWMAMWSMPYHVKGGETVQVPYMSGFGGNRVLFAPNGVVAIRFTDGSDYDAMPLMQVAEGLIR